MPGLGSGSTSGASARSSFLDCTDDPPASRLGSAASIKPKCFSLNVHRATSSGPQDHSLQGLGAGPFCEDRPIQLMSERMLRGRGCRSTFPMLQVGSDGRTAGHGRPQDRAVATVVWLGPLSSPCRDHPSAGTQSTPPCTCGPADLTDTQWLRGKRLLRCYPSSWRPPRGLLGYTVRWASDHLPCTVSLSLCETRGVRVGAHVLVS